MNNLPAIPIGLLVVVLYALFWCGLFVVIGRVSGWIALGQRDHTNRKFEGQCWYFQHAQLRWGMNYSGALTVGVTRKDCMLRFGRFFASATRDYSFPGRKPRSR
jgi:hypothetical protein